jgi:uncharacterized repeat protein (TIGR04138 family)
MSKREELEESILSLVRVDPRYPFQAYIFLHEALEYTVRRLQRKGHVTGQELSHGIREYAIEQFGMMARTVLETWGIHRTDDFGEMVYSLIDHGMWRKTETDSKDDFRGVYRFDEAFGEGLGSANGDTR